MSAGHPINIGPKGRKTRLLTGSAGLLGTLVLFCVLVLQGADPLWRWALFLPFFGSILLLVEAWFSTCVLLATLGAWDLGCGTQKVPDQRLEGDLRNRSVRIVGISLLAALVGTFLLSMLPCRSGNPDGKHCPMRSTRR